MSADFTGGAEQDLAARTVELVRRAAGPAAQAEVFTDRVAQALTRFANSAIHQNVADTTVTVRLRLHLDGRTVTGSTTVVDEAGLRGLVDRVIAAVRVCPPDPGWPGLTPPAPITAPGRWDEATADASADDRAARVRAFVDAAGGLETAGYCRTRNWSAAFVNSAGQAVTGRTVATAMDGVARGGGADGVARLASGRLADIDGAVLGARAAAKARAGVDPVELPPDRYEVVLEPTAVADVLHNLALWGFNGRMVGERRSFAEPGKPQFDPAITLVDDAAGGLGLPFDFEGTPRTALTLVDAGRTTAVTHDRRTAAGAGTTSTGHAPPADNPWGPAPSNLGLVPAPGPGSAPAEVSGPAVDADTADLVSRVERGLLITDFWYTRVLDPRSLVMTGLTRNGVWLIEDGAVVGPVRNLRFTQSYPQALAPGAVLGLGRRATLLPDSWNPSTWSAPAVRLASWNFTGGASG
ncbi:TldD/PmbA family protein [Polymorphospora rubra]|uniref:Peptidase U62 n=1 Tax=Polymorphospora rubra TaxID=338584 RepID=A0A810MZ92_9ACTN|nr:metallopeptidase TldD-related protein [Polymorphospora rubra]BCJ66447.1 peptidase U62 [Polymorphospora rubra]